MASQIVFYQENLRWTALMFLEPSAEARGRISSKGLHRVTGRFWRVSRASRALLPCQKTPRWTEPCGPALSSLHGLLREIAAASDAVMDLRLYTISMSKNNSIRKWIHSPTASLLLVAASKACIHKEARRSKVAPREALGIDLPDPFHASVNEGPSSMQPSASQLVIRLRRPTTASLVKDQ